MLRMCRKTVVSEMFDCTEAMEKNVLVSPFDITPASCSNILNLYFPSAV